MSSGDDGESGVELGLEAKRKEDSSWHPCRISFDSPGDHLIISFGSHDINNILLHKEEVLTHLRFRSIPLGGDDCSSIEGGDPILAALNSQSETMFYDAEVERVQRIRHSKRCCRCSFMIKWLDHDIQAGSSTVPSSSIRKLARNSIIVHPMVAAFLNPQKGSDLCLSDASPLSGIIKDSDSEWDLNALLQKQIEQISNIADASIKNFPGDKLMGIKEHLPMSAFRFSSSLVPGDCNELKRETRGSKKIEVCIHEHYQETKVPESIKELAGNRIHLNPLASCAALASSLLTTKRCLVMDFNSCIDVSMNEKLPLEVSSIPIKPVSKPIQIVLALMSTKMDGPQKPQLAENFPSLSNKLGTIENTLSQENNFYNAENGILDSTRDTAENATSGLGNSSDENTTAKLVTSGATAKSERQNPVASSTNQVRLTRSALQNSARIANDDVQMKIGNDKEKREFRNKRMLARSSTLNNKENLATEVDIKLKHIAGSDSFESSGAISGSKVNTPLKKRKEISSKIKSEIRPNRESRNNNQMPDAAGTTQLLEGKDTGCHRIEAGQKRKAITSSKNQGKRISPLNFLARTRSQTKSRQHGKH